MSNQTITFNEFKQWLTGLIEGKKGGLPDFDDWELIKKKLDSVQPEVLNIPYPQPTNPNENIWTGPYKTKPYENSGDTVRIPDIWYSQYSDNTMINTTTEYSTEYKNTNFSAITTDVTNNLITSNSTINTLNVEENNDNQN